MIVVVSGTRSMLGSKNRATILKTIDDTRRLSCGNPEWRVGDATGVDAFVAEHLALAPYRADWTKYGKAAGSIRNREMLRSPTKADLLLAFPISGSRGTMDCIKQALVANIDVVVTWLKERVRIPDPEPQHRWSGWPGAYCLRCGAEDRRETVCCIKHDPAECDGVPTCINDPCAGRATASDT